LSAVRTVDRSFLDEKETPIQSRRPQRGDLDLIDQAECALGVLCGKWKLHLLFFMARGIHRHGRLLDCLPGASKKVMTDTLRALERDGLVTRRVFAEVPPRVEYSLTELGWTTTEPLMALAAWGRVHQREVPPGRTAQPVNGKSVAEGGLTRCR
jgi:DNA-binding HxlR family transcriptional regulator